MIEYLIIFVLSLPPLFWFRDGFMLLGHDSGFRWDSLAQLPNLYYSWDPKLNFGVDWSIFKGFLITQLPEIVLGQKLALVGWFALIGICMLYFLRSIFPESKYRFFRLFSSIFYMYNYFILDGWIIGERAKFSLFAALPVGLLLIYNAVVKKHHIIHSGIFFGFLYLFLNGGGIFPLYGATIAVLGLSLLFFKASIKTYIVFIVPFVLLNAYFILPSVFLLGSSFSESLGSQGGIEGLILWERVISANASIGNLLRLQGIPSLYNNQWQPFTQVLLANPLFIVLSVIPVITIALGFLFMRPKHPILRFLILLVPVGLLLSMGTHPPIGILYEFAMKKISGFAMFRSSFYKFAPALWFPMIVLTGYYLNELLLRLVKNNKARLPVMLIMFAGLFFYHYPFFTTEHFTIGNGFTTRIKVPSYLRTITADIKKYVGEEETVLIMPKMKEFSPGLTADMYSWGYFSLDKFPRNAVNRRFIGNDSADPIVERLYEALYKGDSNTFKKLSKIVSIDYVLWRGDAISDPQSSEIAKLLLDTDKNIINVFSSGSWLLYKLDDEENGSVWATSTYDEVTASNEGAAYLAESMGTIVSPGTEITEAECVMCATDEYAKLVSSITLPKTRISPESPLYFIEKWRNEKAITGAKTDQEKIDVYISLAQKNYSWGRSDDAKQLMQQAVHVWRSLSGRDRILYAIRLKAYIESQKDTVPADIERDVWMSENGIYRYIASPFEEYKIITSDIDAKINHKIDESGLLFIEIESQNESPQVFLQTQLSDIDGNTPEIKYKKINPTKYTILVKATSPYLLVLQEHYDPRWQISINGKHVKVNSFVNGWKIDKVGEYDITIYYQPQNYFYIGLWISGISLLGSLYYLLRSTKGRSASG